MSGAIGSSLLAASSELLGSGSVLTAGGDIGGPAPPEPPLVPVPLDDLLFYFDAAKSTISDGAVIAQTDLSGNANDLSAMAIAPIYDPSSVNGQPGLTYDGTAQQGLRNTTKTLLPDNSPRSYFCVCKPAAAEAGVLFDWRGGSHNFYLALGFGGTFFVYGNGTSNATIAGGALVPGTPIFVEFYSDGANVSLVINGVSQVLTNSGTAGGDDGPPGFTSGNYYAGLTPFDGDKNVEFGYGVDLRATPGKVAWIREAMQSKYGIPLGVPQLTLSATSSTVAPGAQRQYTAAGGAGGYSFRVTTSNSGGSVNAATGLYRAGPQNHSYDVLTVTDAAGFSAAVNILVSSTTPTVQLAAGERVLFVGDSTTDQANGTAWRSGSPSFAALVNAALAPGAPIVSIDQGHVGATANDVLDNFATWVVAETPKVVFLTVGINDVNEMVAPNTFASQIKVIIDQVLETTATRVIVTGITCYGEKWSAGSPPTWGPNIPNFDAAVDVANTILESAVNHERSAAVIYVNFRQQLLAWEVANNPQPSEREGKATLDGIHPNGTGQTLESSLAFSQVVVP